MNNKVIITPSIERIIAIGNVKLSCLHDIHHFYNYSFDSLSWASKDTHYDRLDVWNTHIHRYIHTMLRKYNFVNGSQHQNPEARIWWFIYDLTLNLVDSPNFQPLYKWNITNRHHCSAYERNLTLLVELDVILDYYIPSDPDISREYVLFGSDPTGYTVLHTITANGIYNAISMATHVYPDIKFNQVIQK